MDSVGSTIKTVRLQQGLTQKEFADILGVTQPHISNIERSRDFPSKTLVNLVFTLFKVGEEGLLHGQNRDISANSVGSAIKAVRLQRGLTQKELGKSLTVTASYVSRVENGKENPTPMFIRLFCLLYSVDENTLSIYSQTPLRKTR